MQLYKANANVPLLYIQARHLIQPLDLIEFAARAICQTLQARARGGVNSHDDRIRRQGRRDPSGFRYRRQSLWIP